MKKYKMEGALTVRQAKQVDEKFDINTEKAEVLEMWTTPEADYGFGYQTASLTRITHYTNETYQLWLDGEMADHQYAIFDTEWGPKLETTHWHES